MALLGSITTAAAYENAPTRYMATAEVLIRSESFSSEYLRKLLNVLFRYMGSDTEMSIIINELDLYPEVRGTSAYDLPLARLRKDLRLQQPGESVLITFRSEDARQAWRVVAFTTERVMRKLADLKDSPFRREIAALDRMLRNTKPKLRAAQLRYYEFKNQHPEVAIELTRRPRGGAAAQLERQIQRTEQELAHTRLGPRRPTGTRARRDSPALTRLRRLESERDRLLEHVTSDHPIVVQKNDQIRRAKLGLQKEQRARVDDTSASRARPEVKALEPAMARLRRLHLEKIEMEKLAIHEPVLQRKWAELSLDTNQRVSQFRSLKARRAQVVSERKLSANEFKENFQLVDVARIPELPSEPNAGQFVIFGLLFTTFIGVTLAGIREALRQTFMDPKEFATETGLEVLAVLPQATGRLSARFTARPIAAPVAVDDGSDATGLS